MTLKPPKSLKFSKILLGMIQCYRGIWPKRSNVLAPLADVSSIKNKKQFTYTEETDKGFIQMKQIIVEEIILVFFYRVHQHHSEITSSEILNLEEEEFPPICITVFPWGMYS